MTTKNYVLAHSRAAFVCRHGWGIRSRLWPALGPPHAPGLIDEVAEGARPPHQKNGGHDMCAESPSPTFNQTFLLTLLKAKTSLLSRAIRCAARRGLSTQSLCRTAFFLTTSFVRVAFGCTYIVHLQRAGSAGKVILRPPSFRMVGPDESFNDIYHGIVPALAPEDYVLEVRHTVRPSTSVQC